MRRRRALFAAIVVVTAGCASVLGLEDRHFVADPDAATNVGGDGAGSEGSSDSASMTDADSGGDAALAICDGKGAIVYAFEGQGGSNSWRYTTDSAVPPMFDPRGMAFRMVSDDALGFDLDHKVPLYMLREPTDITGDQLVSPDSGEAAYMLVERLDWAYFYRDADAPRPLGTTRVVRLTRVGGLTRHRLYVEGDPDDAGPNWADDAKIYYVCRKP